MLNHIDIMGRLTKDPELRRTGTGTAVTSFAIACNRDYGDKEADFVECVAWKNTAEFIANHFAKGSMAIVSGRLQLRKWEDRDGNKRTTPEVVVDNIYFGESRDLGSRYESATAKPMQDYAVLDGDGDDLPF